MAYKKQKSFIGFFNTNRAIVLSTISEQNYKEEAIQNTIKEISEEILSGEIMQKPIYMHKNKRTACEFCSFKVICGFDSKMCNNSYNYIPNLSKNEILAKLKSE